MLRKHVAHRLAMLVQCGKHAAPLLIILFSDHIQRSLHILFHEHCLSRLVLLLVAHLDQLMLWHDDLVARPHQMVLQVVHDEVHGDSVLLSLYFRAASRHNDVGILHSGLHELREGRLDIAMVRLEHALHCPATLHDVSLQAARQADVVIRMHENLQVEHLIDVFIIKPKNALEDDKRGPLAQEAWHVSLTGHIVVIRDGHVVPALQLFQGLFYQLPVEHGGMVKVDFTDIGHLFRRALLVETINRDEGAVLEVTDAHLCEYFICHRCLARGCAACNSNEDRLPLRFCLRQA